MLEAALSRACVAVLSAFVLSLEFATGTTRDGSPGTAKTIL